MFNFERISHFFNVSIVSFEQVNDCWVLITNNGLATPVDSYELNIKKARLYYGIVEIKMFRWKCFEHHTLKQGLYNYKLLF